MLFPNLAYLDNVKNLTSQVWNSNWGILTRWWNEHNSGVRPWTATYTQNLIVQMTVFITAGNYSFISSDVFVVVNKTVGGATTVTLPASPNTGRIAIIKDGKGDAGANNITVKGAAGTIDGAATYVISANYRGLILGYNGTEWNNLALF